MGFISNIRTSIKQIGWGSYGVYLLGRTLRAASIGDAVQYCLMAVDVSAVLQATQASGLENLVPIKRGDPRLEALDAPFSVVNSRLESGAQCHGVSSKGALKAWIWHKAECFDEDDVRARFVLPAGTVWDFGAYVLPEYRLGRSFERLWQGFAALCQSNGIRFSLSRIATHNTASMRAHTRLPHSVLGYCTFIRVFSLQLCLSPLLQRPQFSRTEQDKPVFDVHI